MSKTVFLSSIFILLSLTIQAQKPQHSKYILTDQFGYRTDAKKIAVVRNPQIGFDSAETFSPGSLYAVINTADSSQVLTGSPIKWKSGSTDEQQLIELGAVVGQLASQSVVNRVRLMRDIRGVLTEDQRVEAERLFKRMRRHRHRDKDKAS